VRGRAAAALLRLLALNAADSWLESRAQELSVRSRAGVVVRPPDRPGSDMNLHMMP